MSVSESVAKAAPKRIHRGRAWLSGILIVLSVLAVPTAVVSNWASMQVGNTELFVKTLGPLASNPEIQAAIADQVTNSIDDAVNIEKVTTSIIDGFSDALNLPANVQDALGMVADPVASGVKAMIHQVVSDFVKSPAFQEAWTKVLTLTQEQTVALLSGDPNSLFQLSDDGTLSLPLKPIIVEIKKSLVEQGVTVASVIPEVDQTVTIGQVPELAVARVVYQVGTGVGTWLPWAVLFGLVAGILVANRRIRALVATGITLLAVSILMLVGFDAGGIFLTALVQPPFGDAAGIVYSAVVLYARDIVGMVLTVSIVMILVGWMFSPSTAVIRDWLKARFAAGRAGLDEVGVTMGRAGLVLGSQVTPIRWLIVGLGAFGALVTQPRTSGSIITWTLVTLLLLTVFELAWRAPVAKSATTSTANAATKAKSATRAKSATKSSSRATRARSTSAKSTGSRSGATKKP